MSRLKLLYIILLLGILSCDTAKTVEPIGDKYFLKFYGQVGNQEGVSVHSTPDGGFIIGGNSINTVSGSSDYLLIKVDALGNQEWMETYDSGGDDRLTDVLVESNGYIIAGTSVVNNISEILIKRVDLQGQEGIENNFSNIDVSSYELSGITATSTSEFIIVGNRVSNIVNDSSVIMILSGNLILVDTVNDIHKEVNSATGTNFVKGLEVLNHDYVNYLVLGYGTNGTRIFQFNSALSSPNTSEKETTIGNAQVVDVVQTGQFKYKVLTITDNSTVLFSLSAVNASVDFIPQQYGFQIGGGDTFTGVSLALTKNNDFIVSANMEDALSTNTLSTILESGFSGNINWQRIFGTTSPYKAGKVQVLQDGSVVFTGTAGLESQTKVFLIKLKSNGDMK